MTLAQKKPWYQVSTRFFLLAFCMSYMVMPIISRTVSTLFTTYFYLLVVVWTLFVIIFSKRAKSIMQYLSLLFPFILYEALTYVLRTASILVWGYAVLLFLLPVVIGYYIKKERSHELMRFSKLLIVMFGITLVTTIIGLIRYPQASRVLATVDSSQQEAVLYDWNNIGGYSFIYFLVLLYPLVILAYKQKKIKLWVALSISVAVGTVIILSEYTTALLLFMLTSILFFLKRELKPKELITFAVMGLTVILLFGDVVSNLFGWLGDSLESEVLSERLNALAGGTEGLESSESNRMELYRISIMTFLKNPLFGTMLKGGYGSGGHSQILDILARYGIIGGVLMVWMYRYIYIFFLKPFKDNSGFGFVIWLYIQAIFLSVINTEFWLEVLVLFAPIFIHAIYNTDKE